MQDLNLLRTYCKVLELGSFSKAALALKQPKSRVSRSIARLEQELETELIRRTTRNMAPTHEGKDLYERVSQSLKAIDDELSALAQGSGEIAGEIKISSAEDFGHSVLMRLISDFSALYPKVSFVLQISNLYTDFVSDNVDLAFRIGELKDSALRQTKLSKVSLILVASPKYLKKMGQIKSKQQLLDHNFLAFHSERSPGKISEFNKQFAKPLLTCNSFILLKELLLAAKGYALMPDFYVRDAVKRGELKQLLPKLNFTTTTLQIVHLPQKSLPERVRRFIDFSKENVALGL